MPKERIVGDITNVPQIEFGDGFIANIRNMKDEEVNGVMMTRIIVLPEPVMIQIYEIKQEDMIHGTYLEIILPKDAVRCINSDPRAMRWRTELNYKGEDTVESTAPFRLIMDNLKPLPEELEPFKEIVLNYIKSLNATLNQITIGNLLERIRFVENELTAKNTYIASLLFEQQRSADGKYVQMVKDVDMVKLVGSARGKLETEDVRSEGEVD